MTDKKPQTQPSDTSSRSFFTSKPFIILVATAVILCGGMTLLKTAAENTFLSFKLSLDSKEIPKGKDPDVKVDGRIFTTGSKIGAGRHKLTVGMQDAEPQELPFWVLYGLKNLGTINLESSKGSLLVNVDPAPAHVFIQSAGAILKEGESPLEVSKLPVGEYTLVVRRGDYEETHSTKVQRNQRTEAKIALDLGKVQLSSTPPDADFKISGNGHHWEGKLPVRLDDLPLGNYAFVARRKGWELESSVSVFRGLITTNAIEFPYGSIEINSTPSNMNVSTNGVEIGKTPVTLRELKPDTYSVTVSDGESDLVQTLMLGANQSLSKAFTFHYVEVQLSSTPAGATLYRKNKQIGKTPLTLEHFPVGESPVEFRLDGFVTTNVMITGVEKTTTNYTIKLINESYRNAMQKALEERASGRFVESKQSLESALSIEPHDIDATKLLAGVVEDEKSQKMAAEEARLKAESKKITDIIGRAIEARGGGDLVEKYKAFKMVINTSGTSGGYSSKGKMTIHYQFPNKYREDAEMEFQPVSAGAVFSSILQGRLNLNINNNGVNNSTPQISRATICVAGDTAWKQVQGPEGPTLSWLSEQQSGNTRAWLKMANYSRLSPLLSKDYTLKAAPIAPYAPPNSVGLSFEVDSSGFPINMFFDKESGHLVGISQQYKDAKGIRRFSSQRFSNFQNYAGLVMPSLTQTFDNDSLGLTRNIESFTPFVELPAYIFEPPPGLRR